MIDEIKKNAEKEFIYVEFRNGHQHTLKAFGTWNLWYGSAARNLENQLEYVNYIMQHEHTDIIDVKTTDDKKEAYEKEMITEDGGFF